MLSLPVARAARYVSVWRECMLRFLLLTVMLRGGLPACACRASGEEERRGTNRCEASRRSSLLPVQSVFLSLSLLSLHCCRAACVISLGCLGMRSHRLAVWENTFFSRLLSWVFVLVQNPDRNREMGSVVGDVLKLVGDHPRHFAQLPQTSQSDRCTR